MGHPLAQLDEPLGAQDVDGDGQFELLVELDRRSAVEDDVDGLGELEAVVGAYGEFGLGDVALDRVDLAEVRRPLLSDAVEKLEEGRMKGWS